MCKMSANDIVPAFYLMPLQGISDTVYAVKNGEGMLMSNLFVVTVALLQRQCAASWICMALFSLEKRNCTMLVCAVFFFFCD